MINLGDRAAGSTIHLHFTTVEAAGTPFAWAGTPAISVYKDGGTVESTAGITIDNNFDARTGLHHVAINLSADAIFYAAGSDYGVVITSGTVNGVSIVGYVIAHFTIDKLKFAFSAAEVEQMRDALGINGTKTAAVSGQLQAVKTKTDSLSFSIAGVVDANLVRWKNIVPADLISGRVDANAQVVADKTGYSLLSAPGIQKNAPFNNFAFLMVSAADGRTPATGLSVSGQRSIDGGLFANLANGVTEIGNGWYKVNLAATDLNGDFIALKFTATGADQRNIGIITEP
jgi:hypothetical protein